jgi:hypothetical protein
VAVRWTFRRLSLFETSRRVTFAGMKSGRAPIVVALWFSAISVLASSQARKAWKEYVYAQDGFALRAPHDPDAHVDAALPDSTAYTVRLSPDDVITIRVPHEKRDCNAVLGKLRDGVRNGKMQKSRASSLKEVSISGHPGLEYEWNVSPSTVTRERYYCVNGQFYILSGSRSGDRPLSVEATRILESFRLVAKASK